MKHYLFLLAVLGALSSVLQAQDSTVEKLTQLPKEYLSLVNKKASALEGRLDRKTEQALTQLQKREEKIRRRLFRLDLVKSVQVFASAKERYSQIRGKLKQQEGSSLYIPYLDTLKTSLQFLQKNQQYLAKVKDVESKMHKAVEEVKELEGSLRKAEYVKAFITERKAYLKNQLASLDFAKELKRLNKQAYYYSEQISEYKEVLKDKKKMERKAIELLSRTKVFQDFMRKHSQLASLFRMPGGEDRSGASLQGLQTRAQVNNLLQARMRSGADVQAQLQQNIKNAQAELNGLKDKIIKYSSGDYGNSGSSDMEVPDFKPNSQKSKSFLKRLEYGTNLQTLKGKYSFPTTSDIGLSLGYKMNDKSILGVGASYRVGLGRGWDNIQISHQGIGLRSFVDYQLKGSLFISGGYEQNYRSEFKSIEQLKQYSAWQSSGLVGVSKKYQISKKVKGNMQLLWDFLSYQQIPKTQAILFRIGYSF